MPSVTRCRWLLGLPSFGGEEVLQQSPSRVRPFLSFVAGQIANLDEHIIEESMIPAALKVIIKHPDESTRNHAINLHSIIRSQWMAFQATKRQRTV